MDPTGKVIPFSVQNSLDRQLPPMAADLSNKPTLFAPVNGEKS
jgi:hypothetical protein